MSWRFSTSLDSCDKQIIGTSNSRANNFNLRENSDDEQTKLPECFESEYFAKSVADLYEATLKKQAESPVIEKNDFHKLLEKGKKLKVKC